MLGRGIKSGEVAAVEEEKETLVLIRGLWVGGGIQLT
jgi:hypothetical protein